MEKIVMKKNAKNHPNKKFSCLSDFVSKVEEEKANHRIKYEKIAKLTWDFLTKKCKKFGYEEREGQLDMAMDVVEALRDGENIIVEAGVGIGKSFGYLVPALYMHQEFDKPIAIATSTIVLQEQLWNDVREVSKMLDYQIEMVLAKGQTHFLCRKRASLYQGDEEINNLSNSLHDDRKDIPILIEDWIWSKINVEYNYIECLYCIYSSKSKCSYYELRNLMKSVSGIILCNQDILIAHLKRVKSG